MRRTSDRRRLDPAAAGLPVAPAASTDRVRVLVAHAGPRPAIGGVPRLIGQRLRTHHLDVDVVPARAVRDVDAYDAVLLGGAVARRRWHRHVRRFVRRHGVALAGRPVWVFSCVEPPRRGRGPVRLRGVRRPLARIGARSHELLAPGPVAAVTALVVRPVPGPDGTGHPDAGDWADRVGRTIAWEHHVRCDAIRGDVWVPTG